MKDFTKNTFRISQSPIEVRLAYTGFLILTLLGYVTILVIALWRVGPGYEDIVNHYRGSELDELIFPRPPGQMLEELHFHVFIEAIVLLILTHLIIATSLKRNQKVIIILIAFGSAFTDLASPWLIKYVASGFASLQLASWVGMGASALVLIGIPLWEMWGKKGST